MKIFFLVIVSLIAFCPMVLAQNNSPQGFAVYLLPANIKSKNLSALDLQKLKPAGKPLIAAEDINFYQKETHEFQVEFPAAEKLRKMQNDLRGKTFGVFAGGEAVYAGAFWTSIWSQSFDGVIIDIFDLREDYPTLEFAAGYPSPEWFKGEDRRADKRILKALENAGKLYEEVELVVKCQKITASGTRRPGSHFTFEIVAVTKGEFRDKEINLFLYDGKLLSELDAKLGWGKDENVNFNPDTQIILNLSQQAGREKPDWFLKSYRKK